MVSDILLIMTDFIWEKFSNPLVIKLRNKYDLPGIIKIGKNEFEKQLLLKEWIYNTLPHGFPKTDYSEKSAFEIIDDAKENKPMFCTQYALAYLQCSVALGWYTRKLGIDTDHDFDEEEMHHGVVDIWSNHFQKWYVIDTMHNLHFIKEKIPLNALEIRNEFLTNRGKEIKGVIGNNKKDITYNENSKGFNTPSNYFWFFISLRNNFFEIPGIYNTKTLLWFDEYSKNKIWYMGGGKKGKSYKHPMYASQFIMTNDKNVCFPRISIK